MKSVKIKIAVVFLLLLVGVGGYVLPQQTTKEQVIIEEIVPVLSEVPSTTIDTYFPMIRDTVWKYRGETYADEILVWIDFIKDNVFQLRIKTPNTQYVKIYVKENDALYEVATIEDVKVKMDYTNFRQYKNLMLQVPFDSETSWSVGEETTRKIMNTELNITTQLGEMEVVQVSTVDGNETYHAYYAERLGLVKYVVEKDGKKTAYELVSIEENKPVYEKVKVYLTDINTNEMYHMVEEVAIRTNEEAKHFLTDLLKDVPTESFLTAIPATAYINTIYLQEENNVVEIDMSKEYYDMNYGASFEDGAIRSLATTVGTYYGVDQVRLTVEGEPYQSGHIVFKEGEMIDIYPEESENIR